ncbi:MAG: bifunctional metallophosphatase/5'-nucleotidase [Myxococcales bacterium]|nr:bifunctional metallophosphatase/5'-nucleotidase [Myxococcales bacterium]
MSATRRQRATLRIVAVNDVYSLEELPRLATLIAEVRGTAPCDALLVTLAGDFLAPSLLSSLDQGRGMVDCLNALGVTHVTLGNHEDDLDTEALLARLDELKARVVLSNALSFAGRHIPHDVVSVGVFRVGVLGAVDGDASLYRRPPFGGATLEEPNDAIVRQASQLRADGCDAVVALTHQWLADDRALAATRAVDLILGGHEHEGYLERGEDTPVAKAQADAVTAVVASITLHAGADRPSVRVEVESRAVDDYPEDPSVRRRVDGHLAQVHALEARTLLTLPPGTELSSAGSRLQQTSMGTLVSSRLRDALGAEVGIFNGGGLRGTEPRRKRLTFADFCEELPFDNEAVVAVLPGSVIHDAVRFARTERRGTGGFLQVDDRSEVDPQHHVVRLANAPLEPRRPYRVAIVRDLMTGSDSITPLVDYWRAHPGAVPPATTGQDVKVALLGTFTSGRPGADSC